MLPEFLQLPSSLDAPAKPMTSRPGVLGEQRFASPSARQSLESPRTPEKKQKTAVATDREAELEDATGPVARVKMEACVNLSCTVQQNRTVKCKGCEVAVHPLCSGTVPGAAAASAFCCPHCQLQELDPEVEFDHAPEALQKLVLTLALQSVTMVKGSTIKLWNQLRNLL